MDTQPIIRVNAEEVFILDSEENVIACWHIDQWINDPSVVLQIANNISLAYSEGTEFLKHNPDFYEVPKREQRTFIGAVTSAFSLDSLSSKDLYDAIEEGVRVPNKRIWTDTTELSIRDEKYDVTLIVQSESEPNKHNMYPVYYEAHAILQSDEPEVDTENQNRIEFELLKIDFFGINIIAIIGGYRVTII